MPVPKLWRILTRRKGRKGHDWDMSPRPLRKEQAEDLVEMLNQEYPDYEHRVKKVMP